MKTKVITEILLTLFLASMLTVAFNARALPAITAFFDDLAGFNAAAGFPPVMVDFDDITPGTDITGLTIPEVTFDLGNQPAPSAPLIVVRGIDTYTPPGFDWSGPGNRLFATTGENVLSPGGVELAPGPNPLLENDDLLLTLSTPVSSVGFDILYQSLDGASYTAITLLDAADNVLYYNGFIPIPGGSWAPGGTTFVGFVSDSSNIAKIIINEFDDNNINPDCNIGLDTIRVSIVVASATIDIDPDTLNLKSNGEWITAHIELPEGYDVSNIDVNAILLNGTIPVDVEAPTAVGDYDADGIPDLMVKFNRAEVTNSIETMDFDDETGRFREVTLTISGTASGDAFEGSDTVRLIV